MRHKTTNDARNGEKRNNFNPPHEPQEHPKILIKKIEAEGYIDLDFHISNNDLICIFKLTQMNKLLTFKEIKQHLIRKIEIEGSISIPWLKNSCIFLGSYELNEDTPVSHYNFKNEKLWLLNKPKSNVGRIEHVKKDDKKASEFDQKSINDESEDDKSVQNQPQNDFAFIECFPIHTTSNLTITPNLQKMKNMSLFELQNLQNLIIENEYGKIRYIEPVDVTKFNFDKWIVISHKNCDIYCDKFFKDDEKPKYGNGLNQKAEICLYDVNFDKEKVDLDFFVNLMRQKCENSNAEFVSYEEEGGVLKFLVRGV